MISRFKRLIPTLNTSEPINVVTASILGQALKRIRIPSKLYAAAQTLLPSINELTSKSRRFAKKDYQQKKLRIVLLAIRFKRGFGVDVVVAEQVEYFVARGYDVALIVLEKDGYYDHRFQRAIEQGKFAVHVVRSNDEAREIIVGSQTDIVVAHTPPFFSILEELPSSVLKILFDYGEPPSHLFSDSPKREKLRQSKIKCATECDLVISISDFIKKDSRLPQAQVCYLGNDHLLKRRDDLARLAGTFRKKAGLTHQFLVINVTRYGQTERAYKGIDIYVLVKDALYAAHPELRDVLKFAILGRSGSRDRAFASAHDLLAFSNLSEADLVASYLDSDFYLSTSKWEGYNLGLAQALAWGLDVAATDMGAHSEFRIPLSNEPTELAELVYRSYQQWAENYSAGKRLNGVERFKEARRLPWRDSMTRFEAMILPKLGAKQSRRRNDGGFRAALKSKVESLPLLPNESTPPTITFLILNKDHPDLLLPCVKSIEQCCRLPFEILVGDTGSTNEEALNFYQITPHQVVYLGFYNFSAGNNILARKARGKYLVLLNNDVEIIKSDFHAVLQYIEEDGTVGAVGAYLVYRDRRIQHAGVRICCQPPYRGVPEHFDKFQPIAGYKGLNSVRDVVCVTGAFLLISADNYRRFGGLDEIYQEEAQDADLCFKILQNNMRNIMHPDLLAFHYENSTRTVKESGRDREVLLSRHGSFIETTVYRWQAEQGL